ncbi:response regulator [Paenibacillus sp. JDR-2]|uniref:response regulator n=1 Tax=Paenibacillus sp. (strain JDR-2) TaxID=324057 RepID=UPI000166B02E|nr:response regulator [Paenibacillus sp. JDR-2]ACS98876.1 response regulator receiver and SARP domain protein [Paenibacillus sp. JDR-2]
MKAVLVDDEPVMHLIMRKMLEKYSELTIVGSFSNAKEAEAFLDANEDIDLAFLDISMPGGSGLAIASKLGDKGRKTQVVFVTSHKDFALEAFELSVLDYLVKPVTQERLGRTVSRALSSRKPAQLTPASEPSARVNAIPVIITALGDFSVRNDKGRVKWISSKSAELFAYLLLNSGKRISRHRLLADIFAGMTGSNAEKYLNTTVYQLRKSLEPIGLREAVRSENDGYALELDGAVIDYETFEYRLGELGKLDARNMEEARKAERLYTGDLFGSKSYVWAIHETEQLAARYSSFVQEAAQVLLEIGDTAGASKLLLKLRDRNPLDEKPVALLMKKCGMEGDKKGLTSHYTDYVKILGKELGIKPSKELLFLYDSLVKEISGQEK